MKRQSFLFAMALGLICATLGFSYSLATVPSARSTTDADSAHVARSREGRALRFSDPFLLAGTDANFPSGGDVSADPDGFDLGDVSNGISFERAISTLGGVRPTEISSLTIGTVGGGGVFLDPSGILFGKSTVAGSVAFTASVKDARGTQRSGYFRLFSRTPDAGDFRFAVDRVANAQVGQDYYTKIEAIASDTTLPFYSVVPGSVVLNGTPRTDLEFNGLTLFDDGTLAGRPIISGTMTFTARASKGSVNAKNRAGTAEDQTFTLTVEAESSMQSMLATTSLSLKGDYINTSKGTVAFKGVIQTGDRAQGDFAGQLFIFRIAGTVFSTTLNSIGQQSRGDVRVSLNANSGTISVSLKNVDTALLFPEGTITNRGSRTTVVQMDLGDKLRYTEALECSTTASRSRFALAYKLGKQIQLGGLYQITRVQAKEFFEGTAFRVSIIQSGVLSDPRDVVGDGDATIFFGGTFSQKVPLFRGRARVPPDGIRTISLSNRSRTGSVETFPLTSAETGVPRPSDSDGSPQTFYMGMDVNTPGIFYSGDGVRTIFPFFGRRR